MTPPPGLGLPAAALQPMLSMFIFVCLWCLRLQACVIVMTASENGSGSQMPLSISNSTAIPVSNFGLPAAALEVLAVGFRALVS